MSVPGCLGILGGTFDPPHLSHLEMAKRVYDARLVDRVLMVPCFRHAFGKRPAAFEHRLEMCRCMTRGLEYVEVSDVEQSLKNPGRTLELIAALENRYPNCTFRLVAGADIYRERHKWYRFKEIEEKAPPIYLAREGITDREAGWLSAPADISSSDVRGRLQRGESVAGLLAEDVIAYIVEHQLYGV